MFCVGCGGGEAPGLIQCSLCHRQRGAGPLLRMTVWNEAAQPRCGKKKKTLHRSSEHCAHTTLALQTPQAPSPFNVSPADPVQHKVWHVAACWSSAGAGLAEVRVPESRFLNPGVPLPIPPLTLPDSPQALAAAVALHSSGGRSSFGT